MTLRRCVLLCLCLLLPPLTAATMAAKPKMPPGSFLTKPVSTPAGLADLVKQDKLVGLRYSKHFGMEPAALAQYFAGNLTVSTLSKKGTYTAYYIAKNGKILAHKKTLKAGTKVFLGWDGVPIFDVACGNPLTKSLPMKPVVKVITPPVQIVEPPPAPVPVTPAPVEIVQEPPAPELVVEPSVLVAAEPPTEFTPVTHVAPLQYLLVPSLLGAVGMLGGGHDGGGTVPEPSSLLILGIGGVGLLFRYRKRGIVASPLQPSQGRKEICKR